MRPKDAGGARIPACNPWNEGQSVPFRQPRRVRRHGISGLALPLLGKGCSKLRRCTMRVRRVMPGLVLGAVVSTLAAAQTTTTTTTTTTLLGGCLAEASFTSLTCRTDALATQLQRASDLGRTKSNLMN